MKKKVLSVLLATTMVASMFAGCGGSDSSGGNGTEKGQSAGAAKEQTTIKRT